MKSQGKKILLLISFIGLVMVGFGIAKLFTWHNGSKNLSEIHINQKLPGTIQFEVEPTGSAHRYGRPMIGPLIWENDRKFHEFCANHKITVRMAAFQTTLPDPLPGEEYNVGLAADILAGTVVPSGKVFSTNQTVGPYISSRGFKEGPAYFGTQVIKTIGGGVCKIATTLYNVAVIANLKIMERKPHGMLVPYVPPGQDATVSDGSKDFKFKNNTGYPIIIWADTRENTLYMAIYGRTKPPKVTWHHKILNQQEMRTIYRYNRNLKPGQEKVIISGADGLTVKNWLIIEYPNGTVTKKDLGVDYYRPMLRVIERGSPN